MLVIEDIAVLMIFFLISTILIIVAQMLIQNFFLEQLNKDVSNKLKTFAATQTRRSGSSREPNVWEIGMGFLQTFIDMKKEGLSLKDIIKEATDAGLKDGLDSLTGGTED